MTTQDSDSEITGKVAASLTPPVVHARAARGEQSSGFFDLDTLYAIHVEQVRPPPIRLPPPLPVAQPVRRPAPLAVPFEVHAVASRRAPRPQPIGWFAVFVTWLATTTLATLAATQLPAHGTTHARLLGTSTPASAITPASTPTPTPTLALTPALTPAPPPTPSTPVFSISDLPRVLPRAALPTRRAVPRATTPPPETTAAPAQTTEAAPTPSPAKPPPAAAPASTANSLDDLIRREVAAEQKRLHPPPTP
jgi:hypothetical protein